MGLGQKNSALSIARLYGFAQRMYSALPYRYFKSGYAFPPWHYYLELTRRCNLRCRMCQYIAWLENTPGKEQAEGELTTEEWHAVIDQVHRLSLLTFTGGEPLVRRDFLELMEHASRRARTHLITNATLLDEDLCRALVALAPKRIGGRGFNALGTSIEAPGELHDTIRRMKKAYARSTEGVRMIREFRERARKQCPQIHVTTVIQKDNVDVLPEVPKAMRAVGVDVLNLVTETRMHELPELGLRDPSSYRGKDMTWPSAERGQLSQSLDDTVAAAKAEGIELRLPRMPKADLLDLYEPGKHVKLRDYECRNAWNTCVIGRRGEVSPCWIMRAGNVREYPLKTLWNNDAMRDFRKACQKHVFAMCPGCCFLEHKTEREMVAED